MAATGTEAQIKDALCARLAALVLSPVLPVSYPNVVFTPPSAGMWLEAMIFAAPAVELSVGDSGSNSLTGFLQVTIVDRQKTGEITSAKVAALIAAHFKRGTEFTSGVTSIRINRRPSIMSTFKDDVYVKTPVTIRYQAFDRQT